MSKAKTRKRLTLWGLLVLFCSSILLWRSQVRFYRIPTAAMEGTVLRGDWILATDWNYGLRLGDGRFPGVEKPQRNDLIVFNFPEGDTVVSNFQNMSYYQLARMCGRENLLGMKRVVFTLPDGRQASRPTGGILIRPISEQESYIKRCVGTAGDTLQVIDGIVHINGEPEALIATLQYQYNFKLKDSFNRIVLKEQYDISPTDVEDMNDSASIPLTQQNAEALKNYGNVISMSRAAKPKGYYVAKDFWPVFPNDPQYDWSEDNFGPLWLPKAGSSITLTELNLPLYRRAIQVYEHNTLKVKDGAIWINGEQTDTYTFLQDYYWVMGDNRQRSQDSRFWGFVPFSHVIGKASNVTISNDPEGEIRWSRFFKSLQ